MATRSPHFRSGLSRETQAGFEKNHKITGVHKDSNIRGRGGLIIIKFPTFKFVPI